MITFLWKYTHTHTKKPSEANVGYWNLKSRHCVSACFLTLKATDGCSISTVFFIPRLPSICCQQSNGLSIIFGLILLYPRNINFTLFLYELFFFFYYEPLVLNSTLEEYECDKVRLLSMIGNSKNPVQPIIKTGRKWTVVEATDWAKECLKIKEVIGRTQTDRRGLGSSRIKWWSKVEGKKKRDMVINEIQLTKESRRQSTNCSRDNEANWDNALQKSLLRNDIWHMAPLRISFLIRSVYDLRPPTEAWYDWERRKIPRVRYAIADRPQSMSWALAK